MKLLPLFKTVLKEIRAAEVPQFVYHGGDSENLKSLMKDWKILTPEEKLKYPSSGVGYVGLSTSIDKSKALNYSQAFGNDSILKIKCISPKLKFVDTNGDGIDEIFNDSELEELANSYDGILELEDTAESELRILKADQFKPVGIIK